MKIMITGACGFVARELIKELETRGHPLVLFDRVAPEEATLFWPGMPERIKSPLVTKWPFIQGEIIDPEAAAKAVQGSEAVVHLAAAVSGEPEKGIATMQANVCGTYVLLDAARRAGVKRLLCASSINTFGTFYWRLSGRPVVYSRLPLDETFEPVPEDPYSLSKLCNEHTCAAFTRAFGIKTAALRFAGMWNADQYEKAVSEAQAPTQAWAEDLFQWAHVSDIVTGIRQALEEPNLPDFGVYTLSGADTRCPEPTMELLQKFQPALAATLVSPVPGRTALLSIEKAQKTFGYSPKFRLGL
jgi:UDP-glucose 4-epimerase